MQQHSGAPYLARFLRDVRYPSSICTERSVKIHLRVQLSLQHATTLGCPISRSFFARCEIPIVYLHGKIRKDPPPRPAQPAACNNTRVPHISLVFCEMWDTHRLSARKD